MPPKVDIFLGFDPGGKGEGTPKNPRKFGWSICLDSPCKPRLLSSGTAGYAREVYDQVLEALPGNACVRASGIDAPLFWPLHAWDRQVDLTIRRALIKKGDQTTSVQHINSLAGADLAQGILLAELLRQTPRLRSPKISRGELDDLVQDAGNIQGPDKEHREDAILAAYAAWAMHHQRPGWRNLLIGETPPLYSPYREKRDIGYWMPIP